MNREEILQASRRENQKKDLAELEILQQAGSHASQVGALACCVVSLLSSAIAHRLLYSPWVIYFSMLGIQWRVRFIKGKRKSDMVISLLFFALAVLALAGLVGRLAEAAV